MASIPVPPSARSGGGSGAARSLLRSVGLGAAVAISAVAGLREREEEGRGGFVDGFAKNVLDVM